MNQGLKLLFGFHCLLVLLVACGRYSPIVDSKADVQRLAPSEEVIRCRGLSDADISSLKHLPRLKTLQFGAGHLVTPAKITDEGLARLAAIKFERLETLSLGYCSNITDAGLAHLTKMDSVRWLSLMVCPGITDDGLTILLSMTNLTGLDLRACPAITDKGLEHLAAKMNWQTIWFGGCPNVTVEAVKKLQRALPNVEVRKDEKEWSYHK